MNGLEKRSMQITVRLTPTNERKITEIAERRHLKRGEVINMLVDKYTEEFMRMKVEDRNKFKGWE